MDWRDGLPGQVDQVFLSSWDPGFLGAVFYLLGQRTIFHCGLCAPASEPSGSSSSGKELCLSKTHPTLRDHGGPVCWLLSAPSGGCCSSRKPEGHVEPGQKPSPLTSATSFRITNNRQSCHLFPFLFPI